MADIQFLDRYARPRREKAGTAPAEVIRVDADPALAEKRRLRRVVEAAAQPPSARAWTAARGFVASELAGLGMRIADAHAQRPAPLVPCTVIALTVRSTGAAARAAAPPGRAQIIPVSFVRDDAADAALCRRAPGLPQGASPDTECAVYGVHDPAPGPDAA